MLQPCALRLSQGAGSLHGGILFAVDVGIAVAGNALYTARLCRDTDVFLSAQARHHAGVS